MRTCLLILAGVALCLPDKVFLVMGDGKNVPYNLGTGLPKLCTFSSRV